MSCVSDDKLVLHETVALFRIPRGRLIPDVGCTSDINVVDAHSRQHCRDDARGLNH